MMACCCEEMGANLLPTAALTMPRMGSSVVMLWAPSPEPMLFEQGMEHREAGVIVSRQMNPKPH